MKLTEAEAKTKWCPNARLTFGKWEDGDTKSWSLHNNSRPCNKIMRDASRDGKSKTDTMDIKCIGSECMAWRWCEKQEYEVPMTGEVEDRRGYCGAFGKPDE